MRPPGPTVVVHDLAQARAALASGADVRLASAPHLAAFAGLGFLKALEDRAGAPLLADCGDDAGLVMAAIRAGLRDILFTGDERLRGPLAEMLEAVGGRLHRIVEGPVLSLEPGEDAGWRLRTATGEYN